MSISTCSRSSTGMSCIGSIERNKASVRRNTSGRSSSGMPMMSAITCIGQQVGDVGDEVEIAERGSIVEYPLGARPDPLLEQADHARGETGADQPSHAGVFGRILGDEHHAATFLLERDDRRAVERGERLPVTVGLLYLPVAEHRPEPDVGIERRDIRLRVPADRAARRAPRRTARAACRCGTAPGRAD